MSNQIQSILTEDSIQVLEQAGIIPKGTPPAQVAIFGKVCEERGLSAFSKEIYLVGYAGKYSVIVGINGFRKIAAESGQLAGIDDPIYNLQPDGSFQTAAQIKIPITATVTVWRMVGGQRVPFTHTAVFAEFSTGQQKWLTMPFQMIGKVAEAFALRKGFSDRLTGLNSEEELGAINGQTIQAIRKSPAEVEAALPEKFQPAFEEMSDILSSYTDIADVIKLWQQQPDDAPAKMFATFAKAFFDAAARTAQSSDDLNAFWLVTPKKWQQSQRVAKPLFDRKKELQNGLS